MNHAGQAHYPPVILQNPALSGKACKDLVVSKEIFNFVTAIAK